MQEITSVIITFFNVSGSTLKINSNYNATRRSGRLTNNIYAKPTNFNAVEGNISEIIKKEKNSGSDDFEKGESLLRDDVEIKHSNLYRISEIQDSIEEIEDFTRGKSQ